MDSYVWLKKVKINRRKYLISYSLNKKIDGQKLLRDIQELLNKNNLDNKILVISLADITKDDYEVIPKITYKENI
jgi:hypothetical protein